MEDTILTNTTCTSSLEMNNNNNKGSSSTSLERKTRPQKDEASNCPRCNSTNTKFCYYNNYSLTQPRYFCKTCRRYWTEGGSLRNIPVGGGSRKNKRSSSNYFSNQNNNNNSNPSSISPPQSSSKKLALDPTHNLVNIVPNSQITQNPKWIHNHQPQDLNLGFPQNAIFMETTTNTTQIPNSSPNHQPQDLNLVFPQNTQNALFIENTPKTTQIPNHHQHHQQQVSALELLNGLTTSRGLTPFMPMSMSIHNPNGVYPSSGFPTLMQDFKPSLNNNTLNFSLDHGFGGNLNGYGGNLQQEEANNNNNNGRLLFPFEDLKQVSSNNTTSAHDNQNDSTTNDHDHDHQQTTREQGDSNGYWSGMLGMGGSW